MSGIWLCIFLLINSLIHSKYAVIWRVSKNIFAKINNIRFCSVLFKKIVEYAMIFRLLSTYQASF